MASSYQPEVEGDSMIKMDNQETDGSGQSGENRCFELLMEKNGNEDVFYLKYGDTVQALPEEFKQSAGLAIDEDCLLTNEDVYQLKYVNGKIDIQSINMTAESMPSEQLLKHGTCPSNISGDRFEKQDENKKKIQEAKNIPDFQEKVTSENHGSQGKEISTDSQKIRAGCEKSQGKDSPTLSQEQLPKQNTESDKKQITTEDGEKIDSQKPELPSQLESLPEDMENPAAGRTLNPKYLSTKDNNHINVEANKKPLFSQSVLSKLGSGAYPMDDPRKGKIGASKYSRHAQTLFLGNSTKNIQYAQSFNNTKRVQHNTQSEIENTAQIRKQVSEEIPVLTEKDVSPVLNDGPHSEEETSYPEKETEPPPIPKKQGRVEEKGYTGLDSSSSKEECPRPPERGSKRRTLPKTPVSDSDDGKIGYEGQSDRKDRREPLAKEEEIEIVKSPETQLAPGSQSSSADLISSQNKSGNTQDKENQDGWNTKNTVRSDKMSDTKKPVGAEGGCTKEYELNISVNYQYKRRFNLDAGLPCDQETYMKWNYVLHNPSLLKSRIENLKKQNIPDIKREDFGVEKGLIVDIGSVSNKIQDSDVSKLRDTVTQEILFETDLLRVNSFPTGGVDRNEVSRLIIEESSKKLRNQLWCYANEKEELISYICPRQKLREVEHMIKEVTDVLKVIEKCLEYDMVLSKVFKFDNVKHLANKQFDVTLAIDCLESENKCRVTLKGSKSQVERAELWFKEKYSNKFSTSEMSFNDIRKLCGHNIELVVEDVLSKKEDVFWIVNDIRKKICLCTTEAKLSDGIIHLLKTCLTCKKCPVSKHEVLLEMKEVKDGRVIVRKLEDRDELEVIGYRTLLDKILNITDVTASEQVYTKPLDKRGTEKDYKGNHKDMKNFGDENNDKETNQVYSKEKSGTGDLEQTMPVPVKDQTILKILSTSAELQILVSEQNVRLEVARQEGFLIKGSLSECQTVKERLMEMISEYEEKGKRKPATKQWSVPNGHEIIVKYPNFVEDDVHLFIVVEEVPPEEAKYDKKFKLKVPQLAEGKQKEKMEMCIDQLLSHCWKKNLFAVKLEIPILNMRTSKLFSHTLFELLNRQNTKRNPPLTLYLCTDNRGVYNELVGNCDNCIKRMKASEVAAADFPDQVTKYGSKVPAKLEVSVTIGQINGTAAEAIVNTIGKDLNLSSGNVSKALLASAGQELQEEVWIGCLDPLEFGQIIFTSAYRLQGCKHVLHGSLDGYQGCKSIQDLRQFVLNCLIQADRLGCATIAFPAIGTGNLGYPKPAVAHAMFNAVREYEGRQKCLNEVKFVIYHKDTDTRKEFQNQEKEHAKYYDGERLKRVAHCSSIPISVEFGSLVDIFSDSIIYIWEKKSSYIVKVKDHEFLKNVGGDVAKKWCEHRDNKNLREYLFETSGGDLHVSKIIHVFSEDSQKSLATALYEGLQAAEKNTSVTVFFNKNSQFLRYGDQVVAAFFHSAKEILDKGTCLKGIHMVIDSPVVKSYWNLFSKAAESLCINRQRSDPIRTFEQTLDEPRSQSMEREGEITDNTDMEDMVTRQNREWQTEKDRYLTQPTFCDFYVLAKRKTNDHAEIDTRELLGQLPNGVDIIDSTDAQDEVVLKCKSREEAQTLLSRSFKNQGAPLVFEELPKQSLYNFMFQMKEEIQKDKKELQDKGISFDKASNRLTLPTIHHFCQIESDQSFWDTNRERKDSEGFYHPISCSQEVWEIIQKSKAEYIQNVKHEGITFSHEDGFLCLSNVKLDLPDLDAILDSIKMLEKMSILEVEVDKGRSKTSEEINGWCNSIENDQGHQYIVFVEKKNSVLICCDSYENAQKIKHQIMVKDGQVVPRARRRGQRNFMDSNDSVADVISKAVASPTEQQSDNHHPAINEDTFSPGMKKKPQKRSKNLNFSLDNQAKNLERYTTDEGIEVLVYEANILKLPVDCIVNAANDSLQHGGGVARVIAQAAGRDLDTEGFKYIRKHGKVPVGKVCVTTAGKLHYDCVIHTVGPCWHDYNPHSLGDVKRCESDLYSAIMESFLAAESKGLESIALPAISAAIFAVPVELCVYQYAKATIDYSRNRSPSVLKEIHFIDINAAIISSIQNMFKILLRDKRNPNYSSDKFIEQRKSSFSDISAKQSFTTRYAHKENNSSGEQKDGKSDTITVDKDKCKLEVTCQDIMQVTTDAIVSSEDLMGSGKGYVAKQILRKISVLQKTEFESTKKAFFRFSTKPGDVYATKGYGSDFIHILHAVIPYETRNSSDKEKKVTIKKAFTNVFRTLEDKKINSAVTGLLGAGSDSSKDVQIASKAFAEAFNSYCEKTKRFTKLKMILVCKNQAILSQIKQIFEEQGLLKKDVPPVRPPPPEIGYVRRDNQQDTGQPQSIETCAICMDGITDRTELKCGHAFDRDCIDQAFKFKKVCPTCGAVCGEITGLQPEGTMWDGTQPYESCAGYESCGRIAITYNFPNGHQGPEHPDPNKWYKGIVRTAYLPDNAEGREVLEMLKIAFKRKLTFTIGYSRTTGQDGVITWNDIHHKTDPKPFAQFGYPDPTYLKRVKEELAAKGITPDQIPRH